MMNLNCLTKPFRTKQKVYYVSKCQGLIFYKLDGLYLYITQDSTLGIVDLDIRRKGD